MTVFGQPQNSKAIIVPDPLKPGDAVGVVSVSGPTDEASLQKGIAFLQSIGLRPIVGQYALESEGYVAGCDEHRLSDLNAMIRDRELHGIMFSRGGYGVLRILESVDYEAFTRNPKLLLGMSDITALQLSLFARCRLATLSGPMVASHMAEGLDPVSQDWLVRGITEHQEGRELLPSSWPTLRVLRGGRARGPLLGGCLSLVAALLGAAHTPDFRGAILLLEDVHEPLYRIDRMLTQLKLAGILRAIAALVLGYFLGPEKENLLEETERLVVKMTDENPVPILSGVPHGHALPNLTIPHGMPVELDADIPSMKVQLNRARVE